MRRPFTSLRARLLASHLAVVAIGVAAFLVSARSLAPTFVDRHIDEMGGSMMGATMMADVRRGALTGLDQALMVAAVVSAIAAIGVAVTWSKRLLRPLEPIRETTRKLAAGAYDERVPAPREAELAALADDVNALASALEETEHRRLQLIAEVSHELRTPLATIKGYMEGLVDGVFPPDSEVFVAVGREAGRLERLALDLQTLSRSEEGEPGLKRERWDLAELARGVAERLRPQFQDQDVRLDVVEGPAVWAKIDRDRMTQVFTNIIGNALTHTPPGGTVTVAAEQSAQLAVVTITDTGRGLTSDQLEMVFERFYRADRSLPGGSGIGLTIARAMARRHGGDVWATSPGPGLGSTFTVTVPSSPSV